MYIFCPLFECIFLTDIDPPKNVKISYFHFVAKFDNVNGRITQLVCFSFLDYVNRAIFNLCIISV